MTNLPPFLPVTPAESAAGREELSRLEGEGGAEVPDGTHRDSPPLIPTEDQSRASARPDLTRHSRRVNRAEASMRAAKPVRFRRLKRNELVSPGDFVIGEQKTLEPWTGPGGFRADAFVKPIFRRDDTPPLLPEKLT